jgi:hypothetical protein
MCGCSWHSTIKLCLRDTWIYYYYYFMWRFSQWILLAVALRNKSRRLVLLSRTNCRTQFVPKGPNYGSGGQSPSPHRGIPDFIPGTDTDFWLTISLFPCHCHSTTGAQSSLHLHIYMPLLPEGKADQHWELPNISFLSKQQRASEKFMLFVHSSDG